MMKLSEAIRMNGMMVPQGFGGHSMGSVMEPCALGGALQSIGKQHANKMDDNYCEVRQTWPWASRLYVDCPSECGRGTNAVMSCIYHLNDRHRWTRQQIADWVASIEPQEEQADGGPGPVAAALEVTAL